MALGPVACPNPYPDPTPGALWLRLRRPMHCVGRRARRQAAQPVASRALRVPAGRPGRLMILAAPRLLWRPSKPSLADLAQTACCRRAFESCLPSTVHTDRYSSCMHMHMHARGSVYPYHVPVEWLCRGRLCGKRATRSRRATAFMNSLRACCVRGGLPLPPSECPHPTHTLHPSARTHAAGTCLIPPPPSMATSRRGMFRQ